MRQIWEQDSLSLETIKQNVGIEPWGQIGLAREIEENLADLASLLSWTRFPTYDQMFAVFDLAWRHFNVKGLAGVVSSKQLTFRVNQYRMQPSFTAQVRAAVQGQSGATLMRRSRASLSFLANGWASRRPG